jgi:hypothetical protein
MARTALSHPRFPQKPTTASGCGRSNRSGRGPCTPLRAGRRQREQARPKGTRGEGRVVVPQREPVGAGHGLDVAAVVVGLAEHHKSMTSPFTLMAFSRHRSAGIVLPSRITNAAPSARARSSAAGSSGASAANVAVGGGPRDAVIPGQRSGRGTSAAPGPPARSRSAPGSRAECPGGAARTAAAQKGGYQEWWRGGADRYGRRQSNEHGLGPAPYPPVPAAIRLCRSGRKIWSMTSAPVVITGRSSRL